MLNWQRKLARGLRSSHPSREAARYRFKHTVQRQACQCTARPSTNTASSRRTVERGRRPGMVRVPLSGTRSLNEMSQCPPATLHSYRSLLNTAPPLKLLSGPHPRSYRLRRSPFAFRRSLASHPRKRRIEAPPYSPRLFRMPESGLKAPLYSTILKAVSTDPWQNYSSILNANLTPSSLPPDRGV